MLSLYLPALFPFLTASLPPNCLVPQLLPFLVNLLIFLLLPYHLSSITCMEAFLTFPSSSSFHPVVFPVDSISCPTLLSCSMSALHSLDPLPLVHLSVWPYPYSSLPYCPNCPSAATPTLSLPHPLPLLFWLIHGLREILPWQCNHQGSKHMFLLQRICLCSTHTTSQSWVLHIHQYFCILKLEIWNLNCMLSNGAKMLPWWNNKRKDQW